MIKGLSQNKNKNKRHIFAKTNHLDKHTAEFSLNNRDIYLKKYMRNFSQM